MATITRIRRVANPRRFRNAKGRFVKRAAVKKHAVKKHRARTKPNPKKPVLRRYTVKSLKKELRRRGVKLNPPRNIKRRARSRPRRNPLLIELGAVNPRKRGHVAKPKKHYRPARARTNPVRTRTVVKYKYRTRYRTANAHHRKRTKKRNPSVGRRRSHVMHRRSMRRNPAVFGHSSGKDLLMMTGGILVGVAATKYLPTVLPTSISSIGGGSPFIGVIITGAAAFAAGWIAKKVGAGPSFSDAVLLGGLAQAASQLLNLVAPASISQQLALSGMGDIIPGRFVVPQNPIRDGMPVAALPAPQGMGAFRGAFGGRR